MAANSARRQPFEQLEEFLSGNVSMQMITSIVDLRRRLKGDNSEAEARSWPKGNMSRYPKGG